MARAPSFQFYPKDLLTSRAWTLMSLEARGAYLALLAHAWLSEKPGTLPDDDAILAELSGARERWPEIRDQVARAFMVSGGLWKQARMIEERAAQIRRHKQAQNGGLLTQRKRKEITSIATSTASTPSFASSTATASATAKKEEKKPPCRWRDGFEGFWKNYPHWQGRSHRKPALAAWDAIKPKTPEKLAEILAGLEHARASPDWTRDGGQFVEAAERWLRRHGWDASEGTPTEDVFAKFVAAGGDDAS